MVFDLEGARAAGYSDDEIADYLGAQQNFDTAGARKAGYGTSEIMAHLSSAWAKKDLPAGVSPSSAGAGRGTMGGPTAAELRAPRRSLADVPSGPSAALANVRDNEARREARMAPTDYTDLPQVSRPSLIEQRGAPISAEAQQALQQRLGAMSREERLAWERDPATPGWARDAAAKINPTLDASDSMAAKVSAPGFTLESRARFLVDQGARADIAETMARGQAQRGEQTRALAQATPGKPSLLTPDEEAANREIGRQMGKRSAGARGLYAAREGAITGTAGVMATALRAMGDDEAASFYEKVGQGAEVRSAAAQELRAMQERAHDSGMLASGPLTGAAHYTERMAVGAANSLGQMTPGLAVAATGQGGLGMAMMVTPVFGQSYIQARESGKSPGMAAAYAAPMAALEWVGERYGLLPAAMKALKDKAATKSIEELPGWAERAISAMERRGLFSKPVGSVVRTQAGEQIGEQITGVGQYLLDGTEFGLDKPISLAGLLENMRDTAVQTLLATGAIQAASHGVKGALNLGQQGANAPQLGAGAPSAQRVEPTFDPAPVAAAPAQTAPGQQAAATAAAMAPAGQGGAQVQAANGQATPVAVQLEDDGTGLADDTPPAAPLVPSQETDLDQRAHAAATSPTNDLSEPSQAQKEAGNYAKGHVRISGMDVAIENPQGSTRRGVSEDGAAWENQLQAHYGYIKGTVGNDKDHVDLFIKPGTATDYSGPVFVVDQVNPKTGKFDEHKVVLGASTEEEAEAIYRANYAPDWQGLGAITKLPMGAFKSWVRDGAKRAPLGEINARGQETQPGAAPAQGQQPTPQAGGPVAPAEVGLGTGELSGAGAAAAQAPGLTQTAKRSKKRASITPESDTMLQALAKAGGVSREELAREFGLKPEELKATVKAGNLKGYPFRKDGMGIDRAIETLQQHGYFDGVADEDVRSAFEDAVFSELGGAPRLSTIGQMRQAESAVQEQHEQAQTLKMEDDAEADAERAAIMAADEVLTAEEVSALTDDDIPDLFAEVDSTPDALMRALGFTEQEIADELAGQQSAVAQAGRGEDRQDGARAAPEGTAGRGRQEGPDAARGQDQGLTLAAQSEQDLRDKAARERDAAAADAKQQAELQRRAKADAERGEFTLTGSDSATDVAAAAGQSGLFDAPAPAAPPRLAPTLATGEPKQKKLTKAQQAVQDQRDRLANYLKPGNVVRSYGGFDEVLEFTPAKDGKAWSVKVHEVREVDGQWVRQGKPQDARTHSTMPEDRLMKNGPRAVLKPQAGAEVAYSSPRADGQPFPKAPDRGTVLIAAAPAPATTETAEQAAKAKALDDLNDALGDLGDIFGKPLRLNITPEQEQKLLPVLTRVMDAAFRAGYYSFKDAARFVLDKIRGALGPEVADQITVEHLQGAYIGMSGRYRQQGADRAAAVVAIQSKEEIEGGPARADTPEQEQPNVPSTNADLERDRSGSAAAVPAVETLVRPQERGAAAGADRVGSQDRREGERPAGDAGLPADGAAAGREQGDQPVRGSAAGARPAGRTPGVDDDQRGGGLGDGRVQPDAIAAAKAAQPVDRGAERARKLTAQRAADKIAPRPADLDSVRETLPFLLPGQQEDVFKAEQRHADHDGYGMLFTNQPGTGKTYTGLGIAKRVQRAGSLDTLIVAPSDKVIEDWITSAKDLGLTITQLPDTQSAGEGIVITTYANLGKNMALAARDWRMVITDESHYLMQEKDGRPTAALATLRAITRHPAGADLRARMLHSALYDRAQALSRQAAELRKSDDERNWVQAEDIERKASKAWEEFNQRREEVLSDVAAKQGQARTRVTFLSATPFAYEKTVDYGNGYLFDYEENGGSTGAAYNSGDSREQFFMQHFGYRMRYNKLTEPDANVDRGLMQRQFNGWLKRRGALSGRMLEVEPDYDRRFILVDSAIGTRIDEALEWISEQGRAQPSDAPNGYRSLADRINDGFDYLSRRYLLEAIKASEVLPHVRAHLALGRKVVVFHDYKKGGGFNPFDLQPLGEEASDEGNAKTAAAHNVALERFRSEFKDLVSFPFASMPSPIALFQRELPDVLLFNGDVSPKDRRAAVAKFQDDGTGPAVILVQSAAGKEGISLHDTTGKHQRVLFNLGQPTQPTTAIQQEGRVYRTGQVTNAITRYLNTGTNWEKWAFATTIAERASAAENLGMGEQARALKDGFIAAFEESGDYPAGHEGEGTGGKARDRAANEVISEYDRARGFYWGTQKKDSRTKAKEGADYFATPEPVGLKLVQWLDLRGGEDALEPSAGHGAIARWLPENVNRTAVEPSGTLRARLAMVFEGKIASSDFEGLHIVNKFDGIAMNPPFGTAGRTAIDHLAKATQHLREGGRVAAIIPTGPAADKKFDAWLYAEKDGKSEHPDLHLVADIKLPAVTFERAGTSVMTRIVIIDKLGKGKAAPSQVNRDLTSIEDINELFDRLRDMEIPARTKPMASDVADGDPVAPAPREMRKLVEEENAKLGAQQAEELGLQLVEHVTAKGKTLRGVIRKDLNQGQAKEVDEFTFKKSGGWFIREKHIPAMLEKYQPAKMSLAGGSKPRPVPYPVSTDPHDVEIAAQVENAVAVMLGKRGANPVIAMDGDAVAGDLRAARALARSVFGHKVVFVHQPKGRVFNAITTAAGGNVVVMDVTSEKPAMAVLGHELLHQLRNLHPQVYEDLKDRLLPVMEEITPYAKALNERRAAKGLPPLKDDVMLEERIADVVGDHFTEREFWDEFAQMDRTLFERVADAVLRFIDDAIALIAKRRPFGTEAFVRDLKASRSAVAAAMRELAGQNGEASPEAPDDVRMSLSDDRHTPEERAALERAGLAGRPGAAQKLRQAFSNAMDLVRNRQRLALEIRQGTLDQFTGIRQAITGEIGALPVDQDPYIAARLANGGTSSVMRGLMLHGQARWAPNMQHLEKVPGTKGLLDILAPLGDDVNDFFGWMVGNRAARLMKEGRENNFTEDQIKTLQGLAKGRRAEFVKIAGEYSAFKRSVLDVAEQAGLIDPIGRKTWDHADYIPFYRKIDEKASFSPTGRRGLAGQSSGIRTLRGSAAALNDPLENLLMNFSRLIDASLKNNAIRKTIATLENADSEIVRKVGYGMAGVVVPTSQVKSLLRESGTPADVLEAIPAEAFEGMAKLWAIQAPTDEDVVRVMRDGKPTFYKVSDPLLLRALTSFVPIDSPVLGAMRAFKRLLTAMVTSTPDFMLRNFIRDSTAVAAIARDGFNPAKSVTGIAKSYREAGGFESMLFSGASFQSGHVNASDPSGTAAAMRRALRSKGMNAAAINRFTSSLIDTPAKFWEKYRQVGEAIENANREAVYEATTSAGKGVTAAAYEAKDLMDFNLRGSWLAYQVMADVLPFFNARVQGMYRLGRADPKRLAKVGLMLTLASLMLAFANDGEDWYEELPDWDKDTYWHFKVFGHHFRIPKPFEVGVVFATIPERIGRAIKDLDTGGKTAGRIWANVRDQLAFDPVPQMFRPALDVAMNHDNFRDTPIENLSDEGKLPHARYNARTSDTMRVIAGAAAPVADFTGLSPKRLEHLVNGYLGTVGMYALGASDMLVRELEGKPAGPELRADDLPVVKSFYRVDPARATVFESDLYNMRNELQKLAKTAKAYAREGDLKAQQELTAKHQKKLAAEPVISEAASRLTEIGKRRDAIIADTKLTPAEKRKQLDDLQLKKNAAAKAVMQNPVVRAAQ